MSQTYCEWFILRPFGLASAVFQMTLIHHRTVEQTCLVQNIEGKIRDNSVWSEVAWHTLQFIMPTEKFTMVYFYTVQGLNLMSYINTV